MGYTPPFQFAEMCVGAGLAVGGGLRELTPGPRLADREAALAEPAQPGPHR
jgi:hypothetical protein